MEDFKIKLIFPEGILSEETFTYKLHGKATIFDLKEAFTKEEGYSPEQLRMVYRRPDMDMPLNDTDLLEDIEDQSGQFLIECPNVGILDGQFSIKHDETLAVLVGSKKMFEHFLLTNLITGANIKLPLAKLSFLWPQNMVAVVEKENQNDYIAVQYVIQDNWELFISRNVNDDGDGNVWMVKRKTPEGQMILLKGKRQVFRTSNEKNPRLY